MLRNEYELPGSADGSTLKILLNIANIAALSSAGGRPGT